MKKDYISVCCQVPVEYGKHHSMFALMDEESFMCPKCKEDPCGVEEVGANREINMIETKDLVNYLRGAPLTPMESSEYIHEIIEKLRAHDKLRHSLEKLITTLTNRVGT